MHDVSVARRWDEHWRRAAARPAATPHPAPARELAGLAPGTALDAGCGEGAEAVWLAERGWQVTAVDVSAAALHRAAVLAAGAGVADRVTWVRGDLTTWTPGTVFDLVTTHYAHPDMPPTAFHARLAQWVAPGGTLLVVAHRHEPGHGAEDGHPPGALSTTVADVVAALDPGAWHVITAEERDRPAPRHASDPAPHVDHPPHHNHPTHHDGVLRDVVVCAVRHGRTQP